MPGGLRNNREFVSCDVINYRALPREIEDLLYDPQTSGGLLIAVPEPAALRLLAELQAGGNADAAVIGRVVEHTGFAIELA